MNKLLRDYIREDKSARLFTYKVEDDVNLFIDNLNNEFPRLTGKEWQAILMVTDNLIKEENEFYENRNMDDTKIVLPSSIAGYEFIWINFMKELIEKL